MTDSSIKRALLSSNKAFPTLVADTDLVALKSTIPERVTSENWGLRHFAQWFEKDRNATSAMHFLLREGENALRGGEGTTS